MEIADSNWWIEAIIPTSKYLRICTISKRNSLHHSVLFVRLDKELQKHFKNDSKLAGNNDSLWGIV